MVQGRKTNSKNTRFTMQSAHQARTSVRSGSRDYSHMNPEFSEQKARQTFQDFQQSEQISMSKTNILS